MSISNLKKKRTKKKEKKEQQVSGLHYSPDLRFPIDFPLFLLISLKVVLTTQVNYDIIRHK